MNIEAYLSFSKILISMAIITFLILGYAIVKKDFSKKMDAIIVSVFILDGLVLLILLLNTEL